MAKSKAFCARVILALHFVGDRHLEEIDTPAVFQHWYELAYELGYCLG